MTCQSPRGVSFVTVFNVVGLRLKVCPINSCQHSYFLCVFVLLPGSQCISYHSTLLLRRPVPAAAAPLLAHTLALADSPNSSSSSTSKEGAAVEEPLLLQALQSVGREWFEPSFVHSTPPQQQEYLTAFILAALSRCACAV
jgi:hypothetical protein